MRISAGSNGHPSTMAESARMTASKRAAGGPFGPHRVSGARLSAGSPSPSDGPLSSRAARKLFDEAAGLRESDGGATWRAGGSLGPGSRVSLQGFDGLRLGARTRSELAAELGASRERNSELNWRLRMAEDRCVAVESICPRCVHDPQVGV